MVMSAEHKRLREQFEMQSADLVALLGEMKTLTEELNKERESTATKVAHACDESKSALQAAEERIVGLEEALAEVERQTAESVEQHELEVSELADVLAQVRQHALRHVSAGPLLRTSIHADAARVLDADVRCPLSLVDVLHLHVPEQREAAPPPELRDDARPDRRRPPEHQARQRGPLPERRLQNRRALTSCRAAAARGSGRRA